MNRRESRTVKIKLVKDMIEICINILMLPLASLDKPNIRDFKGSVENLQHLLEQAGNVHYQSDR